ncbi:cation:proton antiporter [Roseimaritima ulvae]|uniref:K(+)/H(+) antiporter NhaP n=1 Tax=Roseimaritima ulvae TaxID=980254 RepID=A0A5B9QRP5_9BACT|nr:sodium:proton antiporter [Roseimaritima ulvae]QEG40360.1 K(+)/H(+) antiporter NhaP [Roseimaritima ulvae]
MELLSYLALVPALGILAQWLAWRTRLPSILLLLAFGIVLGQFIDPDQLLDRLTGAARLAELTGETSQVGPALLFPLVSLSVAIILFEGGLSLQLRELREAGAPTFRLVTVGALLTLALTAVAAHWILDFPWRLSLLLGAILTVTGPTVIGPLLRQIRPSRRVASTLKWEGIVIDPVGAVLAVLVFEEIVLSQGASLNFSATVLLLTKITLIGTMLGVLGGFFLASALRRYWLPDHLHGIAALGLALAMFALSNHFAEESGLIAVTVMGVWLANQKHMEIEHVIEFKEHLRTLLIGCLFILLGSRLDPMQVVALGLPGLGFLAIMILLIRPLSVFGSLWGTALSWQEKAFISSMAPRGIVAAAVSSVFALKLQQSHGGDTTHLEGLDEQAQLLSTVTFLVIIGTVTLYGLVSGTIARKLGLARPNPQGLLIAGADAWVRRLAKALTDLKVDVLLVDLNYNKVAAAKMDGIRAECLNILSDHAREELSLDGIGRFLAMTPNDEVNSLAVREYQSVFGRAETYQLDFTKRSSADSRSLSESLSARVLFGEKHTFSSLRDKLNDGAVIKSTTLSDAFSMDDFRQRNGDDALLLFLLSPGGNLQINTLDRPLEAQPGDTLVFLVSLRVEG